MLEKDRIFLARVLCGKIDNAGRSTCAGVLGVAGCGDPTNPGTLDEISFEQYIVLGSDGVWRPTKLRRLRRNNTFRSLINNDRKFDRALLPVEVACPRCGVVQEVPIDLLDVSKAL